MKDTVQRLVSPNLSEVVRDELIRLITQGTLQPGARLNEVHIAEQLGVSRGPVREAARELEGLGLTTSRPRQGFYVADFTAAQIVEIYEISPWIHQALVEDFATYSDAETCQTILLDVDTIETTSVPDFSRSLLQFRQRMLGHVHNRYLAELALSLFRRFYIVAALVRAEDGENRIKRIIGTQRLFWSALAARDHEKAIEIMKGDSRFWLQDIPPRFASANDIREERAQATSTQPRPAAHIARAPLISNGGADEFKQKPLPR
ncbi:GntR family transcriptional regulator [Ensifer adhaerens]|uniref:GntR family transcriptional regulator n=1 Tax=Ensifer adhaerens TaxID=106592 RepID=UPI003D0519D7